MATLSRELRRELERTVGQARVTAEDGARKAIERLGVGDAEPPSGLNRAALSLRNRLRAHGRQLGDRADRRGTQETYHLVTECAYEHWHRMLFARFLAETELLIEPEHQIAISLSDCQELARGQYEDWLALASSYAQKMLPKIFRPDDPVLDVSLPPETRSELEDLLKDLPSETFLADDSLGWVYQFWQADRKDEVNKSEDKIGADEISAVTQLFTEDYMVLFLLHNTLGAWWAGKVLAKRPELAKSAKSEEELRRVSAVGNEAWEYLRFVREENGPWRPAAGTFPGWPKAAKDITLMDPCMGSGHFLVFALPILVAMRMAEERLSITDAVDAVLRDNLHGLEIDPRCTQIAAFNLAHAAWKLSDYHSLPQLNLACSGLSVGDSKPQWMATLKAHQTQQQQQFYFGGLYDLFKEAPTLGSLINPRRYLGSGFLDEKGQAVLFQILGDVLKDDATASPEKHELGVAAEGLARAAELLARKYTLVPTNVPYLGRGKQDDVLKNYTEEQYPLGKADLATAFVLRCLEFCAEGGSTALVTPQNWLFLTTYTKMREFLLERRQWDLVARLGPGAFDTIGGHVVNVALLEITATTRTTTHIMAGIDASVVIRPDQKAALLRGDNLSSIAVVKQSEQLKNPDARITFEAASLLPPLHSVAKSLQGTTSGDNYRYVVQYWEIPAISSEWTWFQSPSDEDKSFSGFQSLLRWQQGQGELAESSAARIQGQAAFGQRGILVAQMSTIRVTHYLGAMFDMNGAVIIPEDTKLLPAIWAYCSTPEFQTEVRRIDAKLNVTSATLAKVPFNLAHWQHIAAEKYPHGLPEPESDDPTQWLFHGRPEHSTAPLQVAVARLLGYRWPAELDSKMRLSQRARDLVKKCDELLPFVDDDGIVCLPALRGEPTATDRVLPLLLKCGVKPPPDLARWLRDDFFKEHCELFCNGGKAKPFIWHIWDGRQDGFSALVNYHKLAGPNGLGKKTLDSLIYSYLGDWITQQRAAVARAEDGAEGRLAAATSLQELLIKIAKGEPPFDLFIRWKRLHEQPIGWEPDINDGVRLNIRPWLAVDIPKGKMGAGLFRAKPGIKWGKDRGKEPQRPKSEYPWFWGWTDELDFPGGPDFIGDRWNDCHYTTAFKEAARKRATKETKR